MMIFAVWEKGKLMCKVEFIESYIRVGNDYQWNDNHGELIRCKNCRNHDFENNYCAYTGMNIREDGYCSFGERKTDG